MKLYKLNIKKILKYSIFIFILLFSFTIKASALGTKERCYYRVNFPAEYQKKYGVKTQEIDILTGAEESKYTCSIVEQTGKALSTTYNETKNINVDISQYKTFIGKGKWEKQSGSCLPLYLNLIENNYYQQSTINSYTLKWAYKEQNGYYNTLPSSSYNISGDETCRFDKNITIKNEYNDALTSDDYKYFANLKNSPADLNTIYYSINHDPTLKNDIDTLLAFINTPVESFNDKSKSDSIVSVNQNLKTTLSSSRWKTVKDKTALYNTSCANQILGIGSAALAHSNSLIDYLLSKGEITAAEAQDAKLTNYQLRDLLNNMVTSTSYKMTGGTVTCEQLFGTEEKELINEIMDYVKIIIPILIIVLGSLDLSKVVVSSDKDALKKESTKFLKRIIIAAAIFLSPYLANFIMDIFNRYTGSSTCSNIVSGFIIRK